MNATDLPERIAQMAAIPPTPPSGWKVTTPPRSRGSSVWKAPMKPAIRKLRSISRKSAVFQSESGRSGAKSCGSDPPPPTGNARKTRPKPVTPPFSTSWPTTQACKCAAKELVGRKGKAPDGQAKTRMAALGCVFAQHGRDDEGLPLRDHQSTTYLAGFESPSDFGIGLRHRASARHG